MKRWILWDFPRTSWQYDVMVILILAFIFLTPREMFRDQPRVSKVVMLPHDHGRRTFWLEPGLLSGIPAESQGEKAKELLKPFTSNGISSVQLTPIYDAEQEIKGYMAYVVP